MLTILMKACLLTVAQGAVLEVPQLLQPLLNMLQPRKPARELCGLRCAPRKAVQQRQLRRGAAQRCGCILAVYIY